MRPNEIGHSLVEMLGTLAIMGVLSIGAIVGFNYAMNKWRAVELMNEARKRAAVVAMQFTQGRGKASLAEFSKYSSFAGGTFDDVAEIKLENNSFKLTVYDVSPHVCQQIKNSIDSTSIIRKIICSDIMTGNAFLFFNADGSATNPPGPVCDMANGIRCQYNQICTTSGNTPGTCIDKDESWECLTNDDCLNKPNTFCSLTATNEDSIAGGECVSLGLSSGEKNIAGLGILERKIGNLNWWSAKNWCAAKGKKLFDISGNRLKCYHGTNQVTFSSNPIKSSFCCIYDETNPACIYGTTQSIPMQELKAAFGAGTSMWISPAGYRLLMGSGSNHNYSIQGATRDYLYSPLCE